jgi:hypothetical protein
MGELSSALLTTRVEETALGAACAILVGLAVLSLRTVHAATLAPAGYLRPLAQVLDGLTVPGHPTTGTAGRSLPRTRPHLAHDSAAARAGTDLTQLTGVTSRAASLARTVAQGLDRSPPAVSSLPPWPAPNCRASTADAGHR